MIVESPSCHGVPAFAPGLAYIMQQGCPAKPQVIGLACHVVQYLQRVVEIVLVCTVVTAFDTSHGCKLGQNQFQQSTAFQFDKTYTGHGCKHNLVQFVHDTLLRYYPYTLRVTAQGFLCLVLDTEIKLCCKAYAAHHAQGVVAERDIGVQWSRNQAVLHVIKTAETVYQLAEMRLVKLYGKCIDGKIAAVQVVCQCSVLDNRLAAVALIAFTPRTYELDLLAFPFHLGRTEIAEYRNVCSPAQLLAELSGKGNTGMVDICLDHDAVNILGRAFEKQIPDISADYIAFHTHFIGNLSDPMKHGLVQQLCKVVVCQVSHCLSISFFKSS